MMGWGERGGVEFEMKRMRMWKGREALGLERDREEWFWIDWVLYRITLYVLGSASLLCCGDYYKFGQEHGIVLCSGKYTFIKH
jgi:hypothetical protein